MEGVDRYEVEAMLRDASYRYATKDDLHYTGQDARDGIRDLRYELQRELEELRGELRMLREQVADALINGGTLP